MVAINTMQPYKVTVILVDLVITNEAMHALIKFGTLCFDNLAAICSFCGSFFLLNGHIILKVLFQVSL